MPALKYVPVQTSTHLTRILNRRRTATMRGLLGVAVLVLLLAQWTALVHAIVHAPTGVHTTASRDVDAAWGHTADSASCHLLDHLLTGQAPGPAEAKAPFACPVEAAPASRLTAIHRHQVLRPYEALGPPQA